MPQPHKSVLALDVGSKRIGVAVASLVARLPKALTVLNYEDPDLFIELNLIIKSSEAGNLVLGYPRGLDGQHTQQTEFVEVFAAKLQGVLDIPIHFQDEAVTSQRAKEELDAAGKPYSKGDIDSLAACYILEDWLNDNPEVK